MASIRARKRSDGTCGYTAYIRIHQAKVLVYEEAKTFSRQTEAERWAKKREVELEDPEALAVAQTIAQTGGKTLAKLIRRYIDTFRDLAKWGRNNQESLKFLERHEIGKENALTLTTQRLIKHVQERRKEGVAPSTAAGDLIWIGVVLRAAKSFDEL